jgi:hypothetical protein
MAKKDKWEWLKRFMVIAVLIVSLIGAVYGAISYFAKQKTVDAVIESVKLTNKRLELAIEDDNVNRAQGEVDWVEQRALFQIRPEPQTINELASIDRAKQKVIDAKALRIEKQRAYEAAK